MSSTNLPSRRTRVKPGVYYRVGADGKRRYEIDFKDHEGRRRWKVIDGGLREAEAAREQLRERKRKGERIAPSRATFAEVAETWLAAQSGLRPATRTLYEGHLRRHVLPRLPRRGRIRLSELREDHVAELISDMRAAGYSPYTIRGALVPLSRTLSFAVRRGMISENVVKRLERGERPRAGRVEMRVLGSGEIEALLGAADEVFRPVLATAVFSGLRQGELLGLTWRDVDFDAGVIRVRWQWDRTGERVEPKTAGAVREVIMLPALGRLLREHRARSPFSLDHHPVFASGRGTPLHYRNVSRRGLEAAALRAGLVGEGRPRLRFHDLRHSFASLLISEGLDVVFVSRQLGHADASITLRVYAHLFDQARHADRARAALEARFGTTLEHTGGQERRNGGGVGGAQVVAIPLSSTNGG